MSDLAGVYYDADAGRHVLNVSKQALEWLALPVKDTPFAEAVLETRHGTLWAWSTDGHRLHAVKIGTVAPGKGVQRTTFHVNRLVWELKFGFETGVRWYIDDGRARFGEGVWDDTYKAVYKGSETRAIDLPPCKDSKRDGWKVVPERVEFGKGKMPESVNAEFLAQAAKLVGNQIHLGMADAKDINSPFIVASHAAGLDSCDWFAVMMQMQPRLGFLEEGDNIGAVVVDVKTANEGFTEEEKRKRGRPRKHPEAKG